MSNEPFSHRVNAVIENQNRIFRMRQLAENLAAGADETEFGIDREQKQALIDYLKRADESMAQILAAEIPTPEANKPKE